MGFRIVVSDELEDRLKKLKKRNRAMFNAVRKKILQISMCSDVSIKHFKNLKGAMSDFKRVHIGSFVLLFKVRDDVVYFESLAHHDDAYKK